MMGDGAARAGPVPEFSLIILVAGTMRRTRDFRRPLRGFGPPERFGNERIREHEPRLGHVGDGQLHLRGFALLGVVAPDFLDTRYHRKAAREGRAPTYLVFRRR